MRFTFTLFLLLCLKISSFSQFNCSNAFNLVCGQTITAHNISNCNNYYNGPYCGDDDTGYTGKENIYKITITTTQIVQFNLTGCNADLDMFLTYSCSAQSCITSSHNPGTSSEFISATLDPGTYFLIVDGWAGAGSTYNLAYTCQNVNGNLVCTNAGTLTCGQTINSTTTDGANNVVGPYCGQHCNYTGKEKVYAFTVVNTGTYTINLTGLTGDLDMFLMNSCSRNACVAKSGKAQNTAESITKTLTPGTYYLVIDGYKGASSPYSLSLSCPTASPPVDCNTLVNSFYAGNGSDLKFAFRFNSNFACQFRGWKIGNTLYSTSTAVNFIFQNAGTYNVCAEYLDLATNTIKQCCRQICAALPTNCEQVIQHTYTNGKFKLNLAGNAANYSSISWNNDTDHVELDPENVNADCRTITVSVTYFNATTNCWSICCKMINFCPPSSCQDNIAANYNATTNAFNFVYNNPYATQISWYFEDTYEAISNATFVLPASWTCKERVVAVKYFDTVIKCWKICSKKVMFCPPIDCQKAIQYQYVSATNKYVFTLDVPSTGYAVWKLAEGNITLPNGEFVLPSGWACSNKTVTVEYFDLQSQLWRTCSRTVYLCPPVNCGDNIKFAYQAQGNKYVFTLDGYSPASVVWKIEETNAVLPNGEFLMPSGWVCKDQTIQAFYYNTATQCWYLCSKRVTICPPTACETSIDYNYQADGNKMVFTLNLANVEHIVWKIDEDNIYIPNGSLAFGSNWTCGIKTITATYFDKTTQCWRTCCKKINLCPATACASSIDFKYNTSSSKFKFSLAYGNATQVTWSLTDGTAIPNGELALPSGYVCGNKTVQVKYFLAESMSWHVCQKQVTICPPSDCTAAIKYQYNNTGTLLNLTLDYANASEVQWFYADYSPIANGQIALSSTWTCGEKTILVKYKDNTTSCYKMCAKTISICPPSSCESSIQYSYLGASNTFKFVLNKPGTVVAFWKVLEDNQVFNGDLVLTPNYACGNKTIEVTYHDPQTNCYATCSKLVNICPPTNCESNINFVYNEGGNLVTFSFANTGGATNLTWVIEETKQVLGHGVQSDALLIPSPCGVYTATVVYQLNGYWHTCCKKVYLCSPASCSDAISHTTTPSSIQLSLPATSSNATWSSNATIVANGNNATIALTSSTAAIIVSATYKDASLDAYRTCIKSISIQPTGSSCTCTPNQYTGWAVATCNSAAGTGNPVGVLYDLRNTTIAPRGTDWGTTLNSTALHPSNWTIDKIGQVFSITLDQYNNVYLGASDVYNKQYNTDPYGPGQIFKARPENNFIAEPFAVLANSGGPLNGIGDIVYDRSTDIIYASNLEDGKIYRISAAGQIIDSYDPWVVDNAASGIAPQAEQVWALGLQSISGSKKLYFPRISGTERAMYSITLGSNGAFPASGSEQVAFSNIPGVGERITDIAFNNNSTKMIFSERGTNFTTGAHTSKTLGYVWNGTSWVADLQYFVGALVNDVYPGLATGPGENSAGGVDFGATKTSTTIEGCDDIVWASANWMRTPDGKLYYGLQGIAASGNKPSTSATNPNMATDIIIDFDGQSDNFVQKGDLADVEVFKCGNECIAPVAAFTYNTANGAYQLTNQSQGATTYTWDVGNGVIVNGNNQTASPLVVFKHSGNYNICLTATNACGTKTTCQMITVGNENGCGIALPPSTCGNIGGEVLVPVSVTNFNDIIALNFTIKSGNGNALQLLGLEQFTPTIASGNYYHVEQDKIRFFWSNATAKSLTNGTVIFYIRAKIVSQVSSPIALTFVNDPVKIECFNANQAIVPLQLSSGTICANAMAPVSGMIATQENMAVPQVMLKINNADHMTNTSTGTYNINNLASGSSYILKPYKNTEHTNGINGLDIVMLQRHLLQIDPFTSPYKIIAADINNDHTINALDVVNLQRLLIRITDDFPNNTAWRFVPKSYIFGSDVLNSSFPESIEYSPLVNTMTNQDFVAIKVGDLNGSAESRLSSTLTNADRSVQDTVHVSMPISYVEAGEEIVIPIKVKNFKDIVALENTFQWNIDHLDFVGTSDYNIPNLTQGNFGTTQVSQGRLLFSWFDSQTTGVDLPDDAIVCKLHFVQKAGFTGSTQVKIINQPIELLAVNSILQPLYYEATDATIHKVAPLSATKAKQDVNCNGSADGLIQITPQGGTGQYTYLWSTNEVTASISNLTAGHYICTLTDVLTSKSFVVDESIFAPSAIEVALIATADAASSKNNIASSVTGGNAPYTFEWSNGATTSELLGVEPGLYTLKVTDAHGCTIRTEIVVNASTPTSVGEVKAELIKVYPNPTANILYVNTSKSCNYAWSIHTPLGQELSSGKHIGCDILSIDVSAYATGSYLLKITTEGGVVTKVYHVAR